MNIRLKFEILTFSAAPETHFESTSMLGRGELTQHLWVRPLWFSTLHILFVFYCCCCLLVYLVFDSVFVATECH